MKFAKQLSDDSTPTRFLHQLLDVPGLFLGRGDALLDQALAHALAAGLDEVAELELPTVR